MIPDIEHSRLLELISYDKETGKIIRRKSGRGFHFVPGKEAGGKANDGYRRIKLDMKSYQVHRIAWLYVHGVFPSFFIDHINGVKDDNRIENLREVTRSQNKMNTFMPKTNSTGFKNVSRNRGGFLVTVKAGNTTSSKWFADIDDAALCAEQLRSSLHGEFSNNGKKE